MRDLTNSELQAVSGGLAAKPVFALRRRPIRDGIRQIVAKLFDRRRLEAK